VKKGRKKEEDGKRGQKSRTLNPRVGRKEGRKAAEDGKQDRRNCEDEVHPPTHLEGRKGEGTLASHKKELGLWQPYKKSQPPSTSASSPALLSRIAKLSCTVSRFLHY